jgi:hypothetical protein
MVIDTNFPVPIGDNVSLSCPQGFFGTGDTVVRCEQDTKFHFFFEPTCEREWTNQNNVKLDSVHDLEGALFQKKERFLQTIAIHEMT